MKIIRTENNIKTNKLPVAQVSYLITVKGESKEFSQRRPDHKTHRSCTALSRWACSSTIMYIILKQPVHRCLCCPQQSRLAYCNSLGLLQSSKSQINRLQQIQNCLARTVVKAPKSSHIIPILRSLHWLKINERIEYKLLSLTQKVLTTSQHDYLHNLIVQTTGRTRSSFVVTLFRPSLPFSLQITNRSFRYASPHLWNQLPSSFCQPHTVQAPPGSRHPAHHLITVITFALTIYHSVGLSLQT